MKRINIKHNYILPHFIQFSKQILLFFATEDVIRSSRSQVFLKIVVIKKFRNIRRKIPLLEQLYEKEAPTQVFFFEYCKSFKKSFFHRASPVAASGHLHIF